MAKVIAVSNQKGGVGKSATVVHTAAALALFGKRVLVVDLDPQGHVAVNLGHDPEDLEVTIYDSLEKKDFPIEPVIIHIKDNLDIVPSNIHLAKANFTLVGRMHREELLKTKLRPLQEQYAYILIDCPPDLNLLTINALSAADYVLIPVQTQYLSLRGLRDLTETIEEVKEHGNPQLSILGVVPTMFDGTIHAREVLETLEKQFPGKVMEPIKRRKDFAELAYAGLTFFDRDRKSDAEIIAAYKFLAQEVINRA